MHKPKFVSALGLFNVAVFVLATLFLPSAGTFYYDNPLSYYVNSRTDLNAGQKVQRLSVRKYSARG